jgi:hypothetical protein
MRATVGIFLQFAIISAVSAQVCKSFCCETAFCRQTLGGDCAAIADQCCGNDFVTAESCNTCLSQTAQFNHIPTTGLRLNNSDLQIVSIFGNCDKSNGGKSQDCTQVCGQKNCAQCIKMYWGASPTQCVPGCIDAFEIQVATQAKEIAALRREVESLRNALSQSALD